MPRNRFSRIRDAARLATAVDNYVDYIRNSATRPRRVGTGRSRGATTEIYLEPFGFDLPAGTKIQLRVSQEARTQMSSAIGARVVTTPGTGNVGQRWPGFTPAKAVLFVRTGNGVAATSQITGLQYLKYNGNSYSHAFGMATATEKEVEAFGAIRAALLSAGGNRRVSYSPEVQRQS